MTDSEKSGVQPKMTRRPWWDRFLCAIGCHDWREMNGRCCSCGWRDDLWKEQR